MNNIIVIPSRFESSRFPGKSLALIKGITLIERVWRNAKKVQNIEQVFIATDHPLIKIEAENFGAKVVMTSPSCRNGTERIYEAIQNENINPDVVINLQGDAPLLPSSIIQDLVDNCRKNTNLSIATLACRINEDYYHKTYSLIQEKKFGCTFVVFNDQGNALYFSKNIIPHIKNYNNTNAVYKHIGVYAYSMNTLKEYVALEESRLEQIEGLEQLRALENAIPVKVVLTNYNGRSDWSIDLPSDIDIVEQIIREEGELINE